MLAAYEEIARAAAREAGRLIREQAGQIRAYETKSNPNDMVTAVDRAAEESIARILTGAFPEIPILGEEGVAAGLAARAAGTAGKPDVGTAGAAAAATALAEPAAAATALAEPAALPEVWVVDPLDGTMNFVYGLPYSSVSIALARYGEPVVGVVYDPYRDELFTARQGAGAFLNGRRVQVRPAAGVDEAVVATGFPTAHPVRQQNLTGAWALAARARNLRAMGSAALHMAYVACGRLSLFYELHLNPWDLAAGAVLVREAGGRATDTLGRPYTLATRHPVASCGGPVHDEVLQLLAEAGATGEPA